MASTLKSLRASSSILKGLNHPAHGCEERATMGGVVKNVATPKGLQHLIFDWTDTTLSGLLIVCCVTQGGRSSNHGNPGLIDAIPLGLKQIS
jgi:hypothetical protein